MSTEIPTKNPEKREGIDDNDRKFVSHPIDSEFLKAQNASSYLLTTDWLETNTETETKIARKDFENGEVQLLHIAKVTINGDRKSKKKPISEIEYVKLLDPSKPHVEKRRYEFTLIQNGISFTIKYDEFTDSELRILEVNAPSDDERKAFDPSEFPYELTEVTGNEQYVGYRVADLIRTERQE